MATLSLENEPAILNMKELIIQFLKSFDAVFDVRIYLYIVVRCACCDRCGHVCMFVSCASINSDDHSGVWDE